MMATDALTCQQLVELVTDYFEGTLSPEEVQRFEAHLVWCDPCAIYLAQMRQTIAMTGHLREGDLEPKAKEQLLDLFRQWKTS